MSNENSEHEEFEDLIDKAIDEMFVSRAKPQEESQAADEGGMQNAPEAQTSAEEIDLTLSWDQTSSGKQPEGETATASTNPGGAEPLLFEPPPPAQAPDEPDYTEDDEEELDEGAPRMAALKPVYQALLSLDWDISEENIAAVEEELGALRGTYSTNYHLESAVKLALITCKYLRASKAYATPLAIKYLREAIAACEVFLSERGPGKPSPDALTNDLLGLYNDMKIDANRLRSVALKGRAQARAYQPTNPGAEKATAADSAVNPLREALSGLWDSMEQIRGRLRGASAQGVPFAEAIDASCARFQEELKAATALAETRSSQSSNAKLDALERTAQELDGALTRFKEQLAEMRSQ